MAMSVANNDKLVPMQRHSFQLVSNLGKFMSEKKLVDVNLVDIENNKTGVHQLVLAGAGSCKILLLRVRVA